jgi:hypothetical protein
MIEVKTLSFRLRLEKNPSKTIKCKGAYFFVLFCESPFNVNKFFSEEFVTDSDLRPFYSQDDAARFAEEMANFWKMQILINPKLDITRLEELTDLWKKISVELNPELKEFASEDLYIMN